MSDDKTQKGVVTSKPDSNSSTNTSFPKYSELGKIVERGTVTGTKSENTTNSIGPKKPS